MAQILLIDDQPSILTSLSILLKRQGHKVTCGRNNSEAEHFLDKQQFDLVITDLRMSKPLAGMDVLRATMSRQPLVPVIIMTGYATIENAVEAIKAGAFDYITKGFSNQEFLQKVDRALQRGKHAGEVYGHERPDVHKQIIGHSNAMMEVLRLVDKVAASDSTILIQGESGTGKELIARAIHMKSLRRHHPFLAINCGAFPDTLLESELFGYTKGSFTGASRDKNGLFVAASQGTLFLDEVSEMSQAMQIKLLRVLQERAVMPLGSTVTQHVDVRIIAATNRDLISEISKGTFREDLYFRLCVVPVNIPPLRDRKEDIPALMQTFISRFAERLHKPTLTLEPQALDLLLAQTWKGNIRELENFAERLTLLVDKQPVKAENIRDLLPAGESKDTEVYSSLADQEREHIITVLEKFGWNQSKAARYLGIGRTTLWRKIKSHGIPIK
ncbi:MAG: sigma-54 dependent transcriptional regulator [Thermodesulfobacteriota bacterium]|nr:sigma-54 dependent transcriptional regulator [Thermodesulfobacteriota bacterium]